MKRMIFFLAVSFCSLTAFAQQFKYAFVSDTHVGASTGEADLRRTIADINQQSGLDFVIITGDITEMGTNDELKLAKSIYAELKIPYYILPGNHDTGWSESGGVSFIKEFGYDKFTFDHKGYRFIGCASGPYVRMSDGHIPRDATVWLAQLLKKTPKNMPVIFANHYPLDNGLDNWYEAIDLLKKNNVQYLISGHWHTNNAVTLEGIPGTVGRSNLRAKDTIGGYNIVEMAKDTAYFSIKVPGAQLAAPWRKIALKPFVDDHKPYDRPSFEINNKYPQVKTAWSYHSNANVVNTPAYTGTSVIFGNSLGLVEALNSNTGKRIWSFKTGGAIYSSAVVVNDLVILGSGDGNIYALYTKSGKLAWKSATGNSVLGSPVASGQAVFIGGSDHSFRALDVRSGKMLWTFTGVEGPIVGKPLIYQGKVIFGSWGRHLYALNVADGNLAWKWNNGNGNRMFSPAMCTPVATNGIVYIAAPDRYLTAINVKTGDVVWRNKELVRESIGLSADSTTIYGKTMQDDIVAYRTQDTYPGLYWKLNAGFGYEHTPSDLIEKDGVVFYGTRNGVVYTFDAKTHQNLWAHKIDNSMINTVNVVSGKSLFVSTMDGKVVCLKVE
ncbi:MAG: PQQ-binding-like beta-propeller repeat protein [Pedobacter sp.]|nr:PQQ-binding-like beta-propeller repeat protein [Pedobacter sp.]MDQ8051502.1 PQQ-binding-like beta-propeller repeat protein [Pedobacter sp.]